MVLLSPMVEPKINCQLKIKDRNRCELSVSNCTAALLEFCVRHRTEPAPKWALARLQTNSIRLGGVPCQVLFPTICSFWRFRRSYVQRELSHQTIDFRRRVDRTLNNKPNPINRKTSSERDLRRTDASGERVENLILLRISDKEYNLIRSHLEFIDIRGYQSLHEPEKILEYAYFPNRGMVSIVIEISDGRTLEVGVVTKKGFAGGLSGVD